jgi:uncharacterized damage-inducible protein DinB
MNQKGSRDVLDTLVWLIEQAFRGDPHQSILANIRRVREEDWTALPSGGGRSIADILEHVGWAKWMYEDYAFGSASLRGDQPPLIPPQGMRTRPREELLSWISEGHARWLSSVRALPADGELDRDRLTNWGEHLPTRQIIQLLIAHDFYHAGEINHLRALLQRDDRWRYGSMGPLGRGGGVAGSG